MLNLNTFICIIFSAGCIIDQAIGYIIFDFISKPAAGKMYGRTVKAQLDVLAVHGNY